MAANKGPLHQFEISSLYDIKLYNTSNVNKNDKLYTISEEFIDKYNEIKNIFINCFEENINTFPMEDLYFLYIFNLTNMHDEEIKIN